MNCLFKSSSSYFKAGLASHSFSNLAATEINLRDEILHKENRLKVLEDLKSSLKCSSTWHLSPNYMEWKKESKNHVDVNATEQMKRVLAAEIPELKVSILSLKVEDDRRKAYLEAEPYRSFEPSAEYLDPRKPYGDYYLAPDESHE